MTQPDSTSAGPISWPAGRVDVLYEHFKKCIIDQEWRPGTPLNIDRLAREYGASITPVREALARLSADKLVVALPYRGYRVAPLPTAQRLADVLAVRLLLEPAAAHGAAVHASDDDLSALQVTHDALVHLQDSATDDDAPAVAKLNRAFHDRIFQANGNEVLADLYSGLSYHVVIQHVYRTNGVLDLPEVVTEHSAILRALKARDADGAEKAMRLHVANGARRLASAYRAPETMYGSDVGEEATKGGIA